MVCILHYFGDNCASAGYRRIKICDLAVRYGHPSDIARVQIAAATQSRNSLRQTVHTHCASVHQAAKLAAES